MSSNFNKELNNSLEYTSLNKFHIFIGEETNRIFCVGADLEDFMTREIILVLSRLMEIWLIIFYIRFINTLKIIW